MSRKSSKIVSKAEFAKVIGVSKSRVSQLIRDGLPVDNNGTIELTAGKRWVAKNLDANRREARKPAATRTSAPLRGSASQNRNLKLKWEAEIRKLEYLKESGALVDRETAERSIFERARSERDRWIGAIPRIVNRLAAETDGDTVILFPIVDGIIRDQLMELAATPLKVLKDAR